MMKPVPIVLSLASLALLAGGLLILQTGTTIGQREPEQATPVARPKEDGATTIDEAREELRKIPALQAVIDAAEEGRIDDFVALIDGGDYCKQTFKFGYVPPVCASGEAVPGVFVDGGVLENHLAPTAAVTSDLLRVLEQTPVQLEFASRDSRYGEGLGGEYYLVFKAAKAISGADNPGPFDKIGVMVRPGEEKPIRWIIRITEDSNALRWLQQEEERAQNQVLLAPESVDGWIGVGESPPVLRPPAEGTPTPNR